MSFKKFISATGLILLVLVIAGCSGQTLTNKQAIVDESQPHGHDEGDAHE